MLLAISKVRKYGFEDKEMEFHIYLLTQDNIPFINL